MNKPVSGECQLRQPFSYVRHMTNTGISNVSYSFGIQQSVFLWPTYSSVAQLRELLSKPD